MELKHSLHTCAYCASPAPLGQVYCCQACQLLSEHIRPLPMAENNPYEYLDQENFKDLYLQNQNSDFNYLFYAEGLHCSSCVHLLEKLPQFYDGIMEARVHFGKSTVAIKLKEQASLAQAAFVIESLGYKPTLLQKNQNTLHTHRDENRAALIRIAVAGFCAGNIMLFVIPVYSGMGGTGAQIFNWVSFLLFLPILLYSAVPFYRGAWNSLKYKVVNVDLPIALALLMGFTLSLFNLIRGDGAIYFDSTASFIFFILSARYLLKRTQQNYLSQDQKTSFFQNEKYLRQNDDGESANQAVPWNSIQIGDVLEIKRNQTIPAEAELISSFATLDMSLFNGESLPRNFSQGMTLFAGTKVLNSNVLVKINKSFQDSKLGELFQQLDKSAYSKNNFTNLTDKISQKLILVVFSIALIFFIFYSQVDPSQAFNRALALIVLACPCALAFGTPLTYGLAVRKAQKHGILIKDSSVFDKILEIKNVFFDKTGTLTEGSLTLTDAQPVSLSAEEKRAILSLESYSYHPVAFALRKAWPNNEDLLIPEQVEEQLGRGICGYINNDFYEVHHLAESTHDSEIGIEVLKNYKQIARIYFTDSLRPESAKSLRVLKERGLECFMLSGDKKSRALAVAKECFIPENQVFAEMFPEDKKNIIEMHRPCLMIGDGANDALGLKTADVGIAVQGSVDLSLHSADIYFTRGGLSPLLKLFSLAKETRSTLVRNLSLSLAYNTIGGVLALLGFIDPMLAAILMPVSSVAIILSSLWGFK